MVFSTLVVETNVLKNETERTGALSYRVNIPNKLKAMSH